MTLLRQQSDKLLAEWFWTDRWMGSSAFLLPMEPRGVYREMLTQAWRRGGRLPNDHEAIQRAIGATCQEWGRAWPLIARYWRVDGAHLVNDTQLEIYKASRAASERASERGRRGAAAKARVAQAHARAQPEHMLEEQPPAPGPAPGPAPTQAPAPDSGMRAVPPPVPQVPPSDHRVARSRPPAAADAADPQFDRFWAAYPKRTGKRDAQRAWEKHKPSEAMTDLIVAALTRQKSWPQWTREEGRYIPNPSTWLNQGRWDDEPVEADERMFSTNNPKTAGNLAAAERWLAKGKAS